MYGDNAKYIVLKRNNGDEHLFVFDLILDHSFVAKRLCRDDLDEEIISAGFININLACGGESTSLKLKSRPERDTQLAITTFGTDAEDMKLRRS